MDEILVAEIEQLIGYKFRDKQLLVTAFTHSSFSNEHNVDDNEKLEFLGDSLLNFLVSEWLYESLPDEGTLTSSRAKIVSAPPLAQAVERMGIAKFIRMGAGAIKENFSKKFHSNLFESVLGAIYLDGGIDKCRIFVKKKLKVEKHSHFVDYKTKLQEFVQRTHSIDQIVYKTRTNVDGKTFLSDVFVFGEKAGHGDGVRKKEAEQKAAEAACRKLEIHRNG